MMVVFLPSCTLSFLILAKVLFIMIWYFTNCDLPAACFESAAAEAAAVIGVVVLVLDDGAGCDDAAAEAAAEEEEEADTEAIALKFDLPWPLESGP